MSSEHKLPSWVSSNERGIFKDEVMKKLGSKQSLCTSWLSSWKPKDEYSKLHFSYIKKNGEEFVARSKESFHLKSYFFLRLSRCNTKKKD